MEKINSLDNETFDFKELLAILKRRYLVVLLITLLSVVVSGIYSYFIMIPVYQADTVMLVTQSPQANRNNDRQVGMEGLVNSIAQLPEVSINTYVSQLKGEAVMTRVLQKLNLDKAGYTTRSLAGLIGIQADKDSNLIKLTVFNTSPDLAAKIANTMPQEFLDFISGNNEQQMNKSVDLLKKQAATTGKELKEAVANLNNLEAQPRGVPMLDKLIAVKTEDLSKYQSQYLQASMEYQRAVAGRDQAEQQLKNTSPVLETTQFNDRLGKSVLVEEVNPIHTQLAMTVNEKSVVAAEKGVEVKSLKTISDQLTVELKALQAEVGQKKNLLQIAQNEAKRLQATDSLLRTKIDETNIGRSIVFGEENFAVISPATVPGSPVKPNKIKNMTAAFFLGLVVSIGLVLFLNYLDNTVKSPKDIERLFGLPVLGQIPVYNLEKPQAIGGARYNG